jgi:hypothetical protein
MSKGVPERLSVPPEMQLQVLRVYRMKPPPNTLYVGVGHVAADALGKLVSPVVADSDNLILGPSRASMRQHQAARTRYWGSSPSKDLDDRLRGASSLCVVLPPSPGALLSLSRDCAAVDTRDCRVFVADVGAAPSFPATIDPTEVPFDVPSDVVPVRWSALQVSMAAALWHLWCRRSPTAFSTFCSSAGRRHPVMANLCRCHAGFFPRMTPNGLTVSRLDELILRELSDDWLTPVDVTVNALNRGSPLSAWLSLVGDVYIAARLLAWSRHTGGQYVESREEPDATSEMKRWSFRWNSQGGRAILQGLSRIDIAPPTEIGGAVAHGSANPWVVRSTASVPRVVKSSALFGTR